MGNDQLNGCSVIYIEKNIFIDFENEKIVEENY